MSSIAREHGIDAGDDARHQEQDSTDEKAREECRDAITRGWRGNGEWHGRWLDEEVTTMETTKGAGSRPAEAAEAADVSTYRAQARDGERSWSWCYGSRLSALGQRRFVSSSSLREHASDFARAPRMSEALPEACLHRLHRSARNPNLSPFPEYTYIKIKNSFLILILQDTVHHPL